MARSRRSGAGRVAASAIALLGISTSLIVVVAALLALPGCTSASTRTYRMEQKAEHLAAAGDLAGADRLMTTVRERDPGMPRYAVAHARIKARRGQPGAALDLLERAAALGLADDVALLDEPAFDPLRASPRYEAVLATVREGRAAFRRQLREARRPLDPAAARAFPDLAALRAAKDEAERAPFDAKTLEAYQLRRARLGEEWAAALARLADERRGTPDEEAARYALLDLRLDAAAGIDLTWGEEDGARVRDAARAYLAACPRGEHARAARIAAAIAEAASVVPEEFDYRTGVAPAPRCAAALPALGELSADGTADRWSTLATGLRALCLFEAEPGRGDEIRASLDAYDAGPHPDWKESTSLDWLAQHAAKPVRWQLDGPPALAGTTVEGRRVSLADFRGKVTLLDFWSPG